MPEPSSTSAATSWPWARAAATRLNGTASGQRAARRPATGSAPRAIRSRAAPARSSSASSPSTSSACREPDMILTDDQRMLQDTVRPFMAEEGAIKQQLRYWRDTGCTDGYGTDLWKQFAE